MARLQTRAPGFVPTPAVVATSTHDSEWFKQRRSPLYLAGLSLALLAGQVSGLQAQVSVLTSHNDNARTGLNPNETLLTPVTVSTNGFGRIFAQPLDAPTYTQPLYVPNLTIPGKGVHNVVFVGTQHDTVYAFDADSNLGSNAPPLWRTSFINPAAGVTSATTLDAVDSPFQDCHTFGGEIGIVGTPVIDAVSQTLYIVARTREPGTNQTFVQVQRLHALDITTGLERTNSPVLIQAAVPGTGIESNGGIVRFNPAREMQRAALLLAGGVVYIAWASYCDLAPYHGWIIGYNAQTLQQVGVFNVSPNASRGAIWMGGAGLSAAPDGAIFCVTGDGPFDTSANPTNFGDSFLKLAQGTTNLTLVDYFTPFDQAAMDSGDYDLGSGGAIVLPDSAGNPDHPHLVVGCGKTGKIYLLNRDNLGHYHTGNDSQIVQSFPLYVDQGGPPHFFGLPAFFNNRLYVQGVGEYLKAYAFTNGFINTASVSHSPDRMDFRGATPSISANGTSNGIVWQFTISYTGPTSFRAYNADNLSQKLYDSYGSTTIGLPDQVNYLKFVVPTIANGKVYLGTADSLIVFGLRAVIKSITRNPVTGAVRLTYLGPVGIDSLLQRSSDLAVWTDIGTGTPTGPGTFEYTDTLTAGSPTRFYRIHP